MYLLDTNLVGQPGVAHLPSSPDSRVLVLGVGNLLMGDEGVGIHALRQLESEEPMPGVRLLDGGTGGVVLLEDIQKAGRVVMIDATRDGCAAGTVKVLRPMTPTAIPQGLSAHDFGLKDLFAAAAILGSMPDVRLVTVSVETVNPMCLELSEPVAQALPKVMDIVRRLALSFTEQPV